MWSTLIHIMRISVGSRKLFWPTILGLFIALATDFVFDALCLNTDATLTSQIFLFEQPHVHCFV